MPGAFNLSLELTLQKPRNTAEIRRSLEDSLKGVRADVDVRVSRGATSALRNLNSELANLQKNLKSVSSGVQTASSAFGGLVAGQSNAARSAATMAAAHAQATAQVKTLASNTQATTQATNQLSAASAVLARQFGGYAVAARAVSALSRAVKDGVREAVLFQREMIRFQQVSGATSAQVQSVTNAITKLSTTYGVSSRDLAQVARMFRQAGLAGAELKKSLEAVSKASLSATFGDIKETGQGALTILKQFGLGATDLQRALSSVDAISAKFAVDSRDMLKAVERSGVTFRSAGGSLNEFLAIFASVRGTTREASEDISAGLRTILTRVERRGTIETLRQLGVELQHTRAEAKALGDSGLAGQFVGPLAAIQRLGMALKGLRPTDVRYAGIVEELGGYRQVSKVIPLLQQAADAQKAYSIAQYGGVGVTQQAAQAQGALLVRLQEVREKFLAAMRGVTDSRGFQVMADAALKLANALLHVTDAAKPILPLLAAFAGVKLAGAIAGPVRRMLGFSSGGAVPGQGHGDTVPAMLTPGEFVVNRQAAQTIGYKNLAALNASKPTRFVGGGEVHLRPGVRVGQVFLEGRAGAAVRPANLDHSKRFLARLHEATGVNDPARLQSIAHHFQLHGAVDDHQLRPDTVAPTFKREVVPPVVRAIDRTLNAHAPPGSHLRANFARDRQALSNLEGLLFEGYTSILTQTPSAGGQAPFDFSPNTHQLGHFGDVVRPTPVLANYLDAKRTRQDPVRILLKAVDANLFSFSAANQQLAQQLAGHLAQARTVAPAQHKALGGLVQHFAGGGLVPLTAQQQALAAQYLPLVQRVLNSLSHVRGLDPESAFDAGMEELVKRTRVYNPSLGVKFSTYAIPAIRKAMLRDAGKRFREMPRGGAGRDEAGRMFDPLAQAPSFRSGTMAAAEEAIGRETAARLGPPPSAPPPTPSISATPSLSYKEYQAKARAMGLQAGGSFNELRARVEAALVRGPSPDPALLKMSLPSLREVARQRGMRVGHLVRRDELLARLQGTPLPASPDEVSLGYGDYQARARALGIPASGSFEELRARVESASTQVRSSDPAILKMSVAELRALAKLRGVLTKGTRAMLLSRLYAGPPSGVNLLAGGGLAAQSRTNISALETFLSRLGIRGINVGNLVHRLYLVGNLDSAGLYSPQAQTALLDASSKLPLGAVGAHETLGHAANALAGRFVGSDLYASSLPGTLQRDIALQGRRLIFDSELVQPGVRSQYLQKGDDVVLDEALARVVQHDVQRRMGRRGLLDLSPAEQRIYSQPEVAKLFRRLARSLYPDIRALSQYPLDRVPAAYRPIAAQFDELARLSAVSHARFASGGPVKALVMPGEAVFSPDAVRKIGLASLQHMNAHGRLPGAARFAAGGMAVVPGPVSDNTDSVPALLPEGAFVLRKSAAQAIGYDKLAGLGHYAAGGAVRLAGGGPPGPQAAQDFLASMGLARQRAAHIPIVTASQAADHQARMRAEVEAQLVRAIRRQLLSIDKDTTNTEALALAKQMAASAIDANERILVRNGRAVGLETLGQQLAARGKSAVGSRFAGWGRAIAGNMGMGVLFAAPMLATGIEHLGGSADVVARTGNTGGFYAAQGASGLFSGAATGAMMGSMLGPFGTAVGVVAGGLMGLASSVSDASQKIHEARLAQAISDFSSSLNTLTHGGPGAAGALNTNMEALRVTREETLARARSKATSWYGRLDDDAFRAAMKGEFREAFGSRAPEIVTFLNKQAEEIGKANVGKKLKDLETTFVAGNQGLNKEYLRLLGQLKGISYLDVMKDFGKAIRESQRSAAHEAAGHTAVRAQGQEAASFERLTVSVQAAAAAIADLRVKAQGLAGQLQGHLAPVPLASGIGKDIGLLGAPDPALFRAALTSVAGPFGTAGADFFRTGQALDMVKRSLPAAVSKALQSGALSPEGDIGQQTRDILVQMLGGTKAVSGNRSLGHVLDVVAHEFNQLGRGDPTKVLDLAMGDPQALVKRLTEPVEGPFHQASVSLQKAFTENASAFITGLAQLARSVQGLNQQYFQLGQLRLGGLRTTNAFFAQEIGRPHSALDFISLQEMMRPLQERQERLTGFKEAKANDALAISARLTEVQAKLEEARHTRDTAFQSITENPKTRQAAEAAAQSYSLLQQRASNLTSALTNLTNVTERTAAAQEKLRNIEEDRTSRLSFGERFLTSDLGGRMQMVRGATLVRIAHAQGSIRNFSPDNQRLVLETLGAMGNAKLSGLGGVRAPDLKEQLVREAFGDIIELDKGAKREEVDLKKEILGAFSQAETAQKELIHQQGALQTNFFSTLKELHASFFSRLTSNLAREELTRTEAERVRVSARIAESDKQLEQRKVLVAGGIHSGADLTRYQAYQADIAGLQAIEAKKLKATKGAGLAAAETKEIIGNITGGMDDKSVFFRMFGDNVFDRGGYGRFSHALMKGYSLTEDEIKDVYGRFKSNAEIRFWAARRRGDSRISYAPGSSTTKNRNVTVGAFRPDLEAALQQALREFAAERGREIEAEPETRRTRRALAAHFTPREIAALETTFRSGRGSKFAEALKGFDARLFDKLPGDVKSLNAELKVLENRILSLRHALGDTHDKPAPPKAGPPGPKPRAWWLPGAPLLPEHHAVGGAIAFKPRGTDTVPAMLTPGEFVVNRDAAQKHRALLETINRGGGGALYAAGGGNVAYLAHGGHARRVHVPHAAFPHLAPPIAKLVSEMAHHMHVSKWEALEILRRSHVNPFAPEAKAFFAPTPHAPPPKVGPPAPTVLTEILNKMSDDELRRTFHDARVLGAHLMLGRATQFRIRDARLRRAVGRAFMDPAKQLKGIGMRGAALDAFSAAVAPLNIGRDATRAQQIAYIEALPPEVQKMLEQRIGSRKEANASLDAMTVPQLRQFYTHRVVPVVALQRRQLDRQLRTLHAWEHRGRDVSRQLALTQHVRDWLEAFPSAKGIINKWDKDKLLWWIHRAQDGAGLPEDMRSVVIGNVAARKGLLNRQARVAQANQAKQHEFRIRKAAGAELARDRADAALKAYHAKVTADGRVPTEEEQKELLRLRRRAEYAEIHRQRAHDVAIVARPLTKEDRQDQARLQSQLAELQKKLVFEKTKSDALQKEIARDTPVYLADKRHRAELKGPDPALDAKIREEERLLAWKRARVAEFQRDRIVFLQQQKDLRKSIDEVRGRDGVRKQEDELRAEILRQKKNGGRFAGPRFARLPGFAQGGYVHEGSGRPDDVHAKLTRGEYVLRPEAVAAVGRHNLDALNRRGRTAHFAQGGPVGDGYYMATGGSVPLGRGVAGQPTLAVPGNFTSALGNFTQSLGHLANSFTSFAGNAQALAKAIEAMPHSINHTGQLQLAVTLNGTEAMAGMMPVLKQYVEESVNKQVRRIFKSKFSEAGPF